MKLLRVGAGVLNQTPLDWENNRTNILKAFRLARAQGVSVLCLPELCITGYGCEDAFLSPGLQRTAWQVLEEIVAKSRGLVASVGLPLCYNNILFNTACLLVNGRIAGFCAKRYLAREGIHYEPRWFKPWPLGKQVWLTTPSGRFPLGDLHFDCGGVKIAFEICEDAWVSDRPAGNLSLQGLDIVMNPSASHFAFGKSRVRKRFVMEGSRAFGVTYLHTNLLGNEAGRAIYDGGALIASADKLVATGPRFSFRDVVLTSAVVDLDLTRASQARSAGSSQLWEESSPHCQTVDFDWPLTTAQPESEARSGWEDAAHTKEEEFTRALALGLFDYLRKSRSQGFVVSLSGGADSSAVSCLAALMVQLAVTELGLNGFRKKLSYLERIQILDSSDQLVRALLTCVYQSTRNSSQVTRQAAAEVAQALGAEFIEFDVDNLVQDYIELVANAIGRSLTWEQDDIALQNIQARTRAPSVWLLANLRGALLLATSNRSEAAVGYATMDGDTCGGLSPIAGIDKAFLRSWLRWAEKIGPSGLAPLPQLAAVNAQTPTAELRPREQLQTDETDLMPYDLLDAIERAAIRDKRTPLEIYRLMRVRFSSIDRRQLGQWVERFFRLWCRNQWKRERYAPSFHLDDENLDPKTWCRFPILSGGFQRELAELRLHLKNSSKEKSTAKVPSLRDAL